MKATDPVSAPRPGVRPGSRPQRVRAIYERRPYPFGNDKALAGAVWQLNLDWVAALSPDPAGFAPARVLVAGCGDGTEVFNLHRQLPAAAITGVDFSRRSIALARRLRPRAPAPARLRFLEADLTAPGLAARLGGPFDLITCHGVLAYIPNAAAVLRNLARCLAPTGVLYLGVNGAAHASTRLRAALPRLGFDLEVFADTARLRAALRACDAVLSGDGPEPLAGARPAFLATDLFGACNEARPWAHWVTLARRAGLHYHGNAAAPARFQRLAPAEACRFLRPGARADVAGFVEALRPARFHRLLFARAPAAVPPWAGPGLARWRLRVSPLYRLRLPSVTGGVRDRLRPVRLASAYYGTEVRAQFPEWEIELLRKADGRPLREILRPLPLAVPAGELRRQLFFLYHLGVIGLLPPYAPAADRRVSGFTPGPRFACVDLPRPASTAYEHARHSL